MMEPPKNLRIAALNNSILDSPLRRRSGAHGVLPNSTPRLVINDDEAERRDSRLLEESSYSDVSRILVEDTDSLTMCLQMHSENKISKDNAWTVSIIDTFSKLIRNHHKSMQNFQIAGSTLEASTKVFGLRVDSVYNDGVRMVSELSRQTAKALNKQARGDVDDSDRESDKENNATVVEAGDKQPKAKKPKKKRLTVTKNKDTLNAKLETVPFMDPFFAKQNSVVGDINSSKRLMQNIIPTVRSCLKLHQSGQYWDKSPPQILDLKDTIEEIDYSTLPDEAITSITSLAIYREMNLHFHPTLKDYVLSDQIIEDDDAELSKFDNDANHSNHQPFNSSQLEMQFDINAELEPLSQENPYVVDYGDMEQDFDDLNDDDQQAINRCRGLKRQPVVIEDMQPNESIQLEYSYRPLDHIGQFWAGPAHWKFRKTNARSTNWRMSALDRESGVATNNQAPARKKRAKKPPTELTLDFVLGFKNTLVKRTKKTKSTTLARATLIKKWDSKKLKLPTDFKLDKDFFSKFLHAPNLKGRNVNVTLSPDEEVDNGYNYNNQNDLDYCSRVNDNEDDFESETAASQQGNENVVFNGHQTVDFISDQFVGAPDRVEKINIIFAKRAKIVDMKQLKTCCWRLINDQKPTISDSGTESQDPVHFTSLMINLPKVLTKAMAENMSTPLAFYSVLHLANENNLVMTQSDDLQDFLIQLESEGIFN